MESRQELSLLRHKFLNAATLGDIKGMRPYIQTTLASDPERISVVGNAFLLAARNRQVEAINALLDVTYKIDDLRELPVALTSMYGRHGEKLMLDILATRSNGRA